MLVAFPPIFVADTKIIYRYNCIVPLIIGLTVYHKNVANFTNIVLLSFPRTVFIYSLQKHFLKKHFQLENTILEIQFEITRNIHVKRNQGFKVVFMKMMKNDFYFTLKALLVLKIVKFLSSIFGHVEKRLDQKDKVNFKIYDVTTWLTNNCNTHIDQYLKK